MKKIVIAILIFFFILFLIALGTGNKPKPATTSNKTTAKTPDNKTTPGKIIISSDVIYHQDNTPGIGVPFKTAVDPNYPGLSVYWVQQSVSGGQDTCTLYDASTKQMYANRYISNSEYVSSGSGTAYYTNTAIKQDKAFSLLDSLCFKP